ncbi:hypothetical protein PAXRUDRAFT_116418, partial [Paxillus rubicundulus Ve08.2h10]
PGEFLEHKFCPNYLTLLCIVLVYSFPVSHWCASNSLHQHLSMFPCWEFKPYLQPGHEHIWEFDAKVITYCNLYVIALLNADWILEPHCFQIEELCVHADGCFRYQDCFQWPQAYSDKFEYVVCIPNPQKMRENEDPSKKLWELWTPTKDDFELIDPQSPFCIGKLKCSIYYNLYCLYDSAQDIVD